MISASVTREHVCVHRSNRCIHWTWTARIRAHRRSSHGNNCAVENFAVPRARWARRVCCLRVPGETERSRPALMNDNTSMFDHRFLAARRARRPVSVTEQVDAPELARSLRGSVRCAQQESTSAVAIVDSRWKPSASLRTRVNMLAAAAYWLCLKKHLNTSSSMRDSKPSSLASRWCALSAEIGFAHRPRWKWSRSKSRGPTSDLWADGDRASAAPTVLSNSKPTAPEEQSAG